MKILILGPVYPYRGGIAHYTAILAQRLEKVGNEVCVYSFRRQYPAWLYPGSSDRDYSQQPISFSAQYLLDPLYPWTWEHTAQRIIQEKPDIVLIQWWTTFWAPALGYVVARLKHKKVIVVFVIHNLIPHEARPWDIWLVKLALGQTRSFITLSSGQRQRLLSLFPRVRVIQSSLPLYDEFIENKVSKEKARQRLGLPDDIPIALFFGIVRPYKGLKYLVNAIYQLKKKGKKVYLFVAGEFWEDIQVYRLQINTLGLSKQVKIDNRYIPNEEIPDIFSAADLFVAPYSGGTQSAALKLALSFHLPVVVTEAVADEKLQGVDGIWIVPAMNSNALAEAIEMCLTEGRRPVLDSFEDNWRTMITDLDAFVKEYGSTSKEDHGFDG